MGSELGVLSTRGTRIWNLYSKLYDRMTKYHYDRMTKLRMLEDEDTTESDHAAITRGRNKRQRVNYSKKGHLRVNDRV